MHRQTHMIVGATVAVALAPAHDLLSLSLALGGGIAGGIAPDLDISVGMKHRGLSHSIWPALGAIVAGVLVPIPLARAGLIAFGLGYLSHLAADACTVSGVKPLQPLSEFHPRGPIKTRGNVPPLFLRGDKKARARAKGERWDPAESFVALVSLVALFLVALSRF